MNNFCRAPQVVSHLGQLLLQFYCHAQQPRSRYLEGHQRIGLRQYQSHPAVNINKKLETNIQSTYNKHERGTYTAVVVMNSTARQLQAVKIS